VAVREKYLAAIVGIGLAVGGTALLAWGVLRAASGPAYYECIGEGCLDDPWFLAFPGGILAMVFGLILGSWALGSIRAETGVGGPLRAFGLMTGLGALFFGLGVVFLLASNQSEGATNGTFLFLGGLFGLMGIGFIAIDLMRFRSELKTDRLRISGLKGTARVLGVRDSNITINNSPMVNLDLGVNIPGQPPFHTRKRTVISRLSVGALMPGAVLPVLADPSKPTDVVIDWNPAGAGAAELPAGELPTEAAASLAGVGGAGPALAALFRSGRFRSAFRLTSPTSNPEILRTVGRALEQAADRAEHGGIGGVTQTPDGTTVIDGGTTVLVNGKVVSGPGVAGVMAGLPAAIAAALANAPSLAAQPPAPSAASAASSGPAVPAVPATPAADATATGEKITDVPVPGATVGGETRPARVSLDSIQDTGVDIADDRLYTFDLTVSVAGREPYKMKHAAVVPQALTARLARGASFPAHVDPNRPGQIAIQWDR
jgi:hypothetical protein